MTTIKKDHLKIAAAMLVVGVGIALITWTFTPTLGFAPAVADAHDIWYCTDLGDTFRRCNEGNCTVIYQAEATDIREGDDPYDLWREVSKSCSDPEPIGCALWMPDVGDAFENGLVATDYHGGVLLIGTMNEDGTYTVVATVATYYAGDDWFQVPAEYRSSEYSFRIDGCGRWHGATELGLVATE